MQARCCARLLLDDDATNGTFTVLNVTRRDEHHKFCVTLTDARTINQLSYEYKDSFMHITDERSFIYQQQKSTSDL